VTLDPQDSFQEKEHFFILYSETRISEPNQIFSLNLMYQSDRLYRTSVNMNKFGRS